ncbi:hypothetical protein MLD38_006703 [Melastoma candidum]|uniref:Uncharacterized protein n=1 Tax=Melastoma candidum TaxID=119954 RepID=A0ACB9RSI5_9MYRT|nr:hypothetical protein MLD38_006703 [Melastoma candidum]
MSDEEQHFEAKADVGGVQDLCGFPYSNSISWVADHQACLLIESGGTKDDLRLPTNENLLGQIKDGFAEGKDLLVSVMLVMGEEQICALKDIGLKN